MNKYELHAHTHECDLYAALGGAELVHAYADAGYSGIVITDHYFSYFLDWFRDELAGKEHDVIIDRYRRGYHAARNEGEKLGVTVFTGAEVRLPDTINDYLVYGLEEEDFYRLPLLCSLPNLDALLDTLPEHTCVVHAHPFRDKMTVINPSRLFGIEVYNRGTDDFRNRMAYDFAAHYGKAMTSGSDCHGRTAVGSGGIATERTVTSSRELVELLKSGDYTLLRP